MDTVAWVQWMRDQGLLHDFLPTPEDACTVCGGSCKVGWDICWTCGHEMAGTLDAFIPASYSLYSGLESLVGTYKDDGQRWQAVPLGSLLWAIFRLHGRHISQELGDNPIYTWVPSDNPRRGFDHIQGIIQGVDGLYTDYPWDPTVIQRDRSVLRPDRKAVSPASYNVTGNVTNRAVLLLDDLWTTGASLTSAAQALKEAGARKVVGVTLGRQFSDKSDYGRTQEIYQEIKARGWKFEHCPLCA